ncbi:SdrD B-like domain-containing protein [Fibrella aquatica]|uniref:SdrD B-like domain-containing protein n=1 Tax=Fibrella aquatica TaxID=3242487 RepID=UPI00352054C2
MGSLTAQAQCVEPGPTPVAITQSSNNGASVIGTLTSMTDNNFGTGAGTNIGNGQYVRLDFGSAVTMTGVTISPLALTGWGPTYLNGITLQYSTNGTTWTTIQVISGTVNNTLSTFTFSSISARYIQLVTTTNTYVGISEFSVATVGATLNVTGVQGSVFSDFNNNGVLNTTDELGFAGVKVYAYNCDGVKVDEATTDATGQYSMTTVTAADGPLRIEFDASTFPSWAKPTFRGTDGGTDIQFVQAPACGVDLGMVSASEYCQASPRLITVCFVNGTANSTTSPVDVVVSINYLASGTSPAGKLTEVNKNQVGAVWGLAYKPATNQLFSATFLKRHVGIKGALGDIYVTTPGSPADGALFVTIPNAGTIGNDAARGLGTPTGQSLDVDALGKVGRVGLGGLSLNDDGTTLYTINLNSKELVSVDMTTKALTTVAIPTICDLTKGQQVPFAVKYWRGKVYVGVVCDASISKSKADLKAHVLIFDPTTANFSPTPVVSVNMNYTRQPAWNNTTYFNAGQSAAVLSTSWYPWIDTYDKTALMVFKNGSDSRDIFSHPTPILSDLEFDSKGNMILGFMDRIGHMFGDGNKTPDNLTNEAAVTGGDILKATFVSNNSWTIETGISSGSEFFTGDTYLTDHQETSHGGVFYSAQDNLVAMTALDPVNYNSGGVIYLNNSSGAQPQSGAQLYSGNLSNGLFGKAAGMGDLTAACDPLPIEIGNRIWVDQDGDGVQDPCPAESGVAGVKVNLYDITGRLVGKTTTSAMGDYYFNTTNVATQGVNATTGVPISGTYTGPAANTQYCIVFGNDGSTPQFSTVLNAFGLGSANYRLTTANAGNDQTDSDATISTGNSVTATNGFPTICLTTPNAGANHTFDVGLTEIPCEKPGLSAIPSQSICQGSSFALPLSASVTSGTATGYQWSITNAAGTAFTTISGATSLTFTPTGTNLPTSTGGTKYYAITAYSGTTVCSETAFVSLTIKPTQTVSISAPTIATVTQCANTTITLSATTNAVAPDAVQFVYFTSPQSGTAMYTGGTVLGTVVSTSATGNKTLTLNTPVPANATAETQAFYVYALLESADGVCKPSDSFILRVSPKPVAIIGGSTTVCQGTSTTLTLPPGLSYRWSTGATTRQITPAISATTTSAVYSATLTSVDGCVSDPAMFTVTGVACTSCVAGAGRVGGTVYNDFDANGVQAVSELGMSGVTVTIYACDASGNSTLAGTTTTDFVGNYFFSGLTDGVTYRVEFSNVPVQFEQSARGTNSGTSVQFIRSPSCGVSLGLSDPDDYCQTDVKVAVVCFARNNDAATEPVIIDINYAAGTPFAPNGGQLTDVNRNWSHYADGAVPLASKGVAAEVSETGTTFGLAWDKTHKQLLSGAYMRAFAPMKANADGFGEGVIYKMSYASGTAAAPTTWLDLETVLSNGVSGTFVADATYPGSNVYGRTNSNPAKIGYTGLGSMRMALDDSELYAVNLNKLEVLVIPIDATGTPATAQIKRFPLPTDGCPTGSWSDGRPYQAVLGLGVHPVTKRVYATVTCTGPTLADLKGLVYSFDPSDSSPASSDFSLETTIPLNITIPVTNPNIANWYDQVVHPWEVVTPNTTFYTNGNTTVTQNTQPWLAEIEFDRQPNGEYGMLVGTRNRYDDIINGSFYVTGGVLHRVANTGSDASPSWKLESNAVAGDQVSTVNWTLNQPGYAGGNTGLTNRFFKYVGAEGAMMAGTLDYLPGRPEIIAPAMDNVFYSGTSGITWLNRTTGERSRDIRLLSDYTSTGFGNVNFTKANNWGGIVVMCDLAPIQIGNRVWRDDNQNGIQDPCEPPIVGAVVKLYNAAKTTELASVTTNAAGEYYFSSTTITTGNSTSSVATTALTFNTTYALVITNLGTGTAANGLSLADVTITPGESGPAAINSGTSTINNDAIVDTGKPCIKLTTGGPGDINHTYDFGLVKLVCSLTATASASSQSVCSGLPVTLTAQVAPTSSYTYVWSAPAGVTLTGANTATAIASASTAGLYTFTVTVSNSPTCFTTATVSVQVNPATTLPVYQPTVICEGGSATFSITPPVGASAYWTTPTNTTISSSTVTITNATVANSGTYTLFYTNELGCVSSTTKLVTINAEPTLTLASNGIGCVSGNQSYTVLLTTNASTISTNASQFGVTISGNLITAPITVASFAVSATSAAGCVATLPITAPACGTTCTTAPNAGPDQTFCEGPTTATLVSAGAGEQWSVMQQVAGTSPIINQAGSPVTVSGLTLPGIYKFRLASTSVSNCSAVVTVTINAKTPITPFTASTICEGESVTFSINPAAGATAYWTTPANTTVSSGTVTLTNATTANSGTYTLLYTNASGCVSTPVTKVVTVNAKPILSLVDVGCLSDNQSYTAVISTNAASLTTNASQFGVTINGNVLTAPSTVALYTITATSAAGCFRQLDIARPTCQTVCSLSLVTTSLPIGEVGRAYSQTITVSGGTTPYAFSVAAGTLPAGLTLNPTTGVVSGTPTTSGTFPTTIVVTDAQGCVVRLPLSVFQIDPNSTPVMNIVVNAPVCNSATNTYTATGMVSLTNSPAGSLTITDNGTSVAVITVTASQPSASFSLTGISNGPATHLVSASLGTLTANTIYTEPASCTDGSPAYAIAKTVDLSRTIKGGIVTYTVSLTNTGNATGTNLVITDQLSNTAVTFIGSATASVGTFLPGANSGSWSIASLAAGQVATLRVNVQLNQEGITYNTVTAPDGQTARVCTTVPIRVCASSAFEFTIATAPGQTGYQWLKDGQPITGATTNTLSVTALGEYSVTSTGSGSCADGSCCPFIIEAYGPLPSLTAVSTAASCTGSTPLNDARISLVGTSTNAVSYNITKGNSFTAATPLFVTNQLLSAVTGGVLATGLANPASAPGDVYTIRVYTADGCFADTTVTIPPALCNCPAVPVCVPITVRRLR